MCGIVGFLSRASNFSSAEALLVVNKMTQALIHRGPDDGGVWVSKTEHLAIGHRRLSILDLSNAGHQPMISKSGRYVLAFNGEIYNHLELRSLLPNSLWCGNSDTETLLVAFEIWGIETTLLRITGMFAIALWDQKSQELVLVRDRMGEKPLYYGWQGNVFLFGSELKALRCHPNWNGEIDRDVLASFMRFAYVPLPHSIFKGIKKLLPGSYITIRFGSLSKFNTIPTPYWSIKAVANQNRWEKYEDQLAISELDSLLRKTISNQMITDVPFGAFLSGGIDSSTVVALMQAQSVKPIKTFSIGFSEIGYDESIHAKNVASHLGTEHTELYITGKDVIKVFPEIFEIYDEPFADSSQIPTYLISRLAAQQVTVALTGDGGDELFAGYNRYLWGQRIWNGIRRIPLPLREILGEAIISINPIQLVNLFALKKKGSFAHLLGEKINKLAKVIGSENPDELYLRLISQQSETNSIVLGAGQISRWSDSELKKTSLSNFVDRMIFQDLIGYLPDDILTKIDRAAMAVSLETRLPFLDHRLVDFAWRLPMSLKIRDGQSKWVLRQVLYQYVPREMIERPKQGFAVPMASWLRGPLRAWGEALLEKKRLEREGFFNAHIIRKKWEEHQSGRYDWQHWIWNVLVFQEWNARWVMK